MAHARISKISEPVLAQELETELLELQEKSRVCRERFSVDGLSALKITLHRVKASARVHGSSEWEQLLHRMEEGVAMMETLGLEKSAFFGELLSTFERSIELRDDAVSELVGDLARLKPELATVRRILASVEGARPSPIVAAVSPRAPVVAVQSADQMRETLVITQRLRTLMNRVSREFSEESFPRDALGLIDRIHADLSSWMDASQAAECERASDLVEQMESLIMSLSSDTGYAPEFHADIPDGLEIPKTVFHAIRHSTVQFVRNSFAHGFDPALVSPEILISVAKLGNGDIQFSYRDRGRGIDVAKLETRAAEIAKRMGSHRFQVRHPLDLIFVDGVSTSDGVTELAGRGVGMSVVASEVKNVGGVVDVRSELGVGTEFCLTFSRRGAHG